MQRKEATKAAVLDAGKKYLDQEGLAHLVQKNDARYVRKEDGNMIIPDAIDANTLDPNELAVEIV